MAKKIAPINRESVAFKRFDEVASQINNEPKKQKKYGISIRVNQDVITRYENGFNEFVKRTGNFNYIRKKDFLKLIVSEMVEELKQENAYLQMIPEFEKTLKKQGRRPSSIMENKNPEISLFFGYYTPEEEQLFKNMMYSIAQKEMMKNIHMYSHNYFFVQILRYLEANIQTICRKYKL